jgi:ribonuclease Z
MKTEVPARPGHGPVVISQDLSVFDISREAVVVRQRTIDPAAWPVVGPTQVSGPPMSQPHQPPAWWADALITD